MPRKARELSALEVGRLAKPGRWSVGGVNGLALQITATGARSWVLRVSAAGRRREMGLGTFPTVTLAAVRDKARRHRSLAEEGTDPVAARRALLSAASAEQLAQKTFTEAFFACVVALLPVVYLRYELVLHGGVRRHSICSSGVGGTVERPQPSKPVTEPKANDPAPSPSAGHSAGKRARNWQPPAGRRAPRTAS